MVETGSMQDPQYPTVSVILPTFNRAHLIKDSIESLLAQTVPITEILIIDDGSTDNTEEVVSGISEIVTYHKKPNGGKLSGINVGLKMVSSELVWIMDDDDLAPVDALENLIRPFVEDPTTQITYGLLQKFAIDAETGERKDVLTYPYPEEDGRSFFVHVMEDCFITGQPCLLISKAAYDAIYPLREEITISEDYCVLLDLAQRFDATRVNAVTLLQRQHDGPRGPSDIRYAADARNSKWSIADTELLGELLPKLSLGEFIGKPASEAPETPGEVRQAYLQKATIAGRKKLWPMAIEALEAAVEADPTTEFSSMDLNILDGMLGCRYGLDELLEAPEWMDKVRATLSKHADGDAAIMAIASLLPYLAKTHLKDSDYRRLAGVWNLYWRLSGLKLGVAYGFKRLSGT